MSQVNLEELLSTKAAELEPLLEAKGYSLLALWVGGSHSHNLNVEDSDVDYRGIYVANTDLLMGLGSIDDSLNLDSLGDVQLHEVGKFLSLVVKGNPYCYEGLCSQTMLCFDDNFVELLRNRGAFLHEGLFRAYKGYLLNQLQRFEKNMPLHTSKGKMNNKFAMHIARACSELERLSLGQEPRVWFEGTERQDLLKIRDGGYDPDTFMSCIRARVERCSGGNLPECNETFANNWLINLRSTYWTSNVS